MKWRYDKENKTWWSMGYKIHGVQKAYKLLGRHRETIGYFKKLKHAKHVAEKIYDENY